MRTIKPVMRVKKLNYDRKIKWLFNSEETELQAQVTNHFGSFIGNEWTAEDCQRFEDSLKEDLTVREYLETSWSPYGPTTPTQLDLGGVA